MTTLSERIPERWRLSAGLAVTIATTFFGALFAAVITYYTFAGNVKAENVKSDIRLATQEEAIKRLDREKESKESADSTRREILSKLDDIEKAVSYLREDVRRRH